MPTLTPPRKKPGSRNGTIYDMDTTRIGQSQTIPLVAAPVEDVLRAVAAEEGIAPEVVEAYLEEDETGPAEDIPRAAIEVAFPAQPPRGLSAIVGGGL